MAFYRGFCLKLTEHFSADYARQKGPGDIHGDPALCQPASQRPTHDAHGGAQSQGDTHPEARNYGHLELLNPPSSPVQY
jgi:hypothetical protein